MFGCIRNDWVHHVVEARSELIGESKYNKTVSIENPPALPHSLSTKTYYLHRLAGNYKVKLMRPNSTPKFAELRLGKGSTLSTQTPIQWPTISFDLAVFHTLSLHRLVTLHVARCMHLDRRS